MKTFVLILMVFTPEGFENAIQSELLASVQGILETGAGGGGERGGRKKGHGKTTTGGRREKIGWKAEFPIRSFENRKKRTIV